MKQRSTSIITAFLFAFLLYACPEARAQRSTDLWVLPSPGAYASGGSPNGSVNLSTGTLQVGIPLCSQRGHSMQAPVSMGYQASGLKVNQLVGPVGLGWSLQAGGIITRVVRGRPDDDQEAREGTQDSGCSGANGLYTGTGGKVEDFVSGAVEYADSKMQHETWDGEPDIYYFNFMGYSGRFGLDKTGKYVGGK